MSGIFTPNKKWCTFCQKDNHNDSECWSTRPVPFDPSGGMRPSPINLAEPPFGLKFKSLKKDLTDDEILKATEMSIIGMWKSQEGWRTAIARAAIKAFCAKNNIDIEKF